MKVKVKKSITLEDRVSESIGETDWHRFATQQQLHYAASTLEINKKNLLGQTPLIAAVIRCYFHTVMTIIFRAPDLNAQGLRGNTALQYAVKAGEITIIKALIRAGVNVNITSLTERTPIQELIESGPVHIIADIAATVSVSFFKGILLGSKIIYRAQENHRSCG